VSGSWDKTLRLWDVESGDAIGSPLLGHDDLITSVAYSLDGKTIVSGSQDRTVRLWYAESGEPLGAPIKVHGAFVMSIKYSPDGRQLASASEDTTIRLWDVAKMANSEGTIASSPFTHDCSLDNSWVTTAKSELLLWLPSWNRLGLMWPSNTAIIGISNITELDLVNFAYGSNWEACKADAKIVEVNI